MSVISLVYISNAVYEMTDDDLRAILEISRRNNMAQGITGMLLYKEGFFIQALEGEKEAVEALFVHIRRDSRHAGVLVLYNKPIEERSFADWSMGFNKIEDEDGRDIEGFTDFLSNPDAAYFTEKPSRALQLLEVFRERSVF